MFGGCLFCSPSTYHRLGVKMSPLFLLVVLGVSGVYCDSHTVRWYYTVVSGKGFGLPEFSVVGYVDDKLFLVYTSDTQRARLVFDLMDKDEGPDDLERETHSAKNTEPVFRHNVRTVMSRFNQTGGIHSFQEMCGCELRDDGSTVVYDQYGYDGRDFLYLDTQSWLYIPAMHEAQLTTQRVNSPEEREGEIQKNYLENECIGWLRQYLPYGRELLEKRVRPEVAVWGRQQSDGVTRLQCLAYGFHPRAVDVKWVRNGEDHIPSDEATPILPHPDGTYQTRVGVEVLTREGDTYSCHVDHSSLEETLSVLWEPDNGLHPAVIPAAVICGLLVVVAAVIGGVVLYKRKKPGYKATDTSEAGSDSSNNPTA